MRTALALLLGLACSATPRAQKVAAPAASPPATTPATALDQLIEAGWVKAGVTPAPPASDGEWLRRVTLDLIGRVPTLAEAQEFLADTAPDKRARLVDRLLARPEAGEHFADLEGELLFAGTADRRIQKENPREFLATAFNDGWSYDRIATELVTASGSLRENRATGFLIARARGGGGPEAAAGAVARIFLGLSIQCAQCHDHPYDQRWKQADFYNLVAYFARTRSRRERGMGMDDKTFALTDQKRGEAKMRPPGATTDTIVPPRFLGRSVAALGDEPRRRTLARALVGSDLFAKALVGRIWARLFGAGLADPWDDLGAENDPRHPALLVALAADFRKDGFDLRRLLARLVLSTAYARSATAAPDAPDSDGAALRAFARARVRPLSPEQLFRTVITATGSEEMVRNKSFRPRRNRDEPLARGNRALGARYAMAEAEADMDERDPAPSPGDERVLRLAARTLRELRFAFDDDEMADADFDGTLPQALLLFNGELSNEGARAGKGGVLASLLARTRDPDARIDGLFMAAYTRPPTPQERALVRGAIEAARSAREPRQIDVYEDAFFALLTSTEAVTNH